MSKEQEHLDALKEPADKINGMVDAISAGNFTVAQDHFDDILGDKIDTALDQHKVAIANDIYNDTGEEEEASDEDLTDEDLEEIEAVASELDPDETAEEEEGTEDETE
jgi:hypothetical protein